MKKIVTLLLALITVLSMATLAGCGEDAKKEDSKSDATPKATATADTDKKPVEDDKTSEDIQPTEKPTEKPSSNPEKDIIGKWETTIDYGKMLQKAMNSEKEEGDPDIKVGSLKIDMYYEFDEDGKVSITAESGHEDKIKKFMNDLYIDVFTESFTKEAKDYDMTLDEYLEMMEVSSIEEYVDTMMSAADDEEFSMEEPDREYEIKDGKLAIESEDGTITYTFTLTEKTLSFTDSDDKDTTEMMLPLTFKKAK